MRLTVYTDFSLRVLIFLALKGDELGTIAEIAKAYGISKNHLMKVAHQLGRAGYIETVRGKGGGLRLARRPEEIVIGDVVRRTESGSALVPCFAPRDDDCVIYPRCILRGALAKAQNAFLATLDEYSLADFVRPRAPLRKLLLLRSREATAARGLRVVQA